MELNILRADPAGNITVFVLDPVEKAQRAAIAEKIMAIPALKAEQVGERKYLKPLFHLGRWPK